MKRFYKFFAVFLPIVMLLQISVSAATKEKSFYQLQEQGSRGALVAISGQYAYVVSGTTCFSLMDIRDPERMQKIAHLDFTDPITSLQALGGYLYMTTTAGLYILDIREPLHPVFQPPVPIQSENGLLGLSADNGRLYLFDKNSIFVCALDDPAKPALVMTYRVTDASGTNTITDVAARGGLAYVTLGYAGVKIYSFSDPNAVSCIGTYAEEQGCYTNIDFFGNLAFLRIAEANTAIALDITDASHPLKLKVLPEIKTGATGCGMEMAGHFALLLDSDGKIHVFDVVNPAEMKEISLIDTTGAPVYLRSEGNLVYAVDATGKMSLLDITKPPFVPIPPVLKTAYITIDDGPSREITPKMLDTLKQYGVKATFFVIPKSGVDDLYQRIIGEGHALGNHSYSHDVTYLYTSTAAFKKDVLKARDFIFNKFGYTSTVYRFPGGTMGHSKTSVAARADILSSLGYKYFDWNVSTADTDPNLKTYGTTDTIVTMLVNNVLNNAKDTKKLVVLMHDSPGKTYTALALPRIIEGLQKQGYNFDVLTNY